MTDVISNFRATQRIRKIKEDNFDAKIREAVEIMMPYKNDFTREEFKCFLLYILSKTTDKIKPIKH